MVERQKVRDLCWGAGAFALVKKGADRLALDSRLGSLGNKQSRYLILHRDYKRDRHSY
jgi:hypothetical protein